MRQQEWRAHRHRRTVLRNGMLLLARGAGGCSHVRAEVPCSCTSAWSGLDLVRMWSSPSSG
uniref:Uncharacterized protein n=1 Tax=Arundo donax TaxID=35708 RepID=A0A0A9HP54_ARUDO